MVDECGHWTLPSRHHSCKDSRPLNSEQLFKIFLGKEAKRIEIIQNKEDKEELPGTLPPFLISFFLIFLSEDCKKGRAARFA